MHPEQGSHITIQNPHATAPLIIPIQVEANTSDEQINHNVRANSRLNLPWLRFEKERSEPLVIVGGGPSAAHHIHAVMRLQAEGAIVFALNAAAGWLASRWGVYANCQVIIDARPENIELVAATDWHLLASQVDPSVIREARMKSGDLDLMHLASPNIEDQLPEDRRKAGGYALVGGGYNVGNSALCAAYVMGYRDIHLIGFDCSNRREQTHAYDQPVPSGDVIIDTLFEGKVYWGSATNRAAAFRFQSIATELERNGCRIEVYGSGLLPAMWHARKQGLSEREKYRLMWQVSDYRVHSPGQRAVDTFLELVRPTGTILDIGCGTGRAALEMHRRGHKVILTDFAENCRDPEAEELAFIAWDWTGPKEPVAGPGIAGFCCDVMEHIRLRDVVEVIRNIMGVCQTCFFQISTVDDVFGEVIGERLHNTVRPHKWWAELFTELGFVVQHQLQLDEASQFVITHQPAPSQKG